MYACLAVTPFCSTFTQRKQGLRISGIAGEGVAKVLYSAYTIAKELGIKIELAHFSKAEDISVHKWILLTEFKGEKGKGLPNIFLFVQ